MPPLPEELCPKHPEFWDIQTYLDMLELSTFMKNK
jgi:hypothetical protein